MGGKLCCDVKATILKLISAGKLVKRIINSSALPAIYFQQYAKQTHALILHPAFFMFL